MQRMIFHFVPTLELGGLQRQMAAVAVASARAGDEVRVVALYGGGPLQEELRRAGIEVFVLRHGGRRFGFVLGRLAFDSDEVRYRALVHSWGAESHPWVVIPSHRLIMTQDRPVRASRLWLARWITRRRPQSRILVVNSRSDAAYWRRHGWPAEAIKIIAGGVAAVDPLPLSPIQLRQQLGLPPSARLVAVMGTLRPSKRYKDAIWATDLLQVAGHDVHLLVFGDGPQYERLRKFAAQANVAHRVHFMGVRADAPRWLPHCEAFWAPGTDGGHPMAVLEAMAAGVPVVAADTPSMRELIVHGESGFLVPPGDRAGLARWVHRLFEEAELAERIGRAARSRAHLFHSVESLVHEYQTLYSSIFDPDQKDARRLIPSREPDGFPDFS